VLHKGGGGGGRREGREGRGGGDVLEGTGSVGSRFPHVGSSLEVESTLGNTSQKYSRYSIYKKYVDTVYSLKSPAGSRLRVP
jgi:hypothetical protein